MSFSFVQPNNRIRYTPKNVNPAFIVNIPWQLILHRMHAACP